MSPRFRTDTAGTLTFYPPENAPSSAATVALYYSGGGALQAAASATCDATSTTIATAAARSAQSVVVALATGIVAGKKYVIAEGGRTQVVTVRSLASTTLYLEDRLAFALTTSATFKGFSLAYSLTSTHTADIDRNYRAHWAYTISGTAYQAEQLFDVVAVDQAYPTTWSDVLARHGWIQEEVRTADLDGATYLDTAWDLVREKFRARQLHLDRVRDLDQVRAMHCAAVNWLLADERAMRDPAMLPLLEQAERRLTSASDDLFSNLAFYDADDDLNASDSETNIVVPQWTVTR
jgi:hypothetical protein